MSNYVTLAQLKAYRPVGSSSALVFTSFSDSELQSILNNTEKQIEELTGNIFYKINKTLYVNGNGRNELFLVGSGCSYPIVSVSSVQEVSFEGHIYTTFVENIDFKLSTHSLILNNCFKTYRERSETGEWPKGQKNIKIVGYFGMETTPEMIKKAVSLLAICNSIGPEFAGIGEKGVGTSTNTGVNEIGSQSWPDYSVSYRAKVGTSQTKKEKEVPTLTGYLEIDRILAVYVNYSELFMVI